MLDRGIGKSDRRTQQRSKCAQRDGLPERCENAKEQRQDNGKPAVVMRHQQHTEPECYGGGNGKCSTSQRTRYESSNEAPRPLSHRYVTFFTAATTSSTFTNASFSRFAA